MAATQHARAYLGGEEQTCAVYRPRKRIGGAQ